MAYTGINAAVMPGQALYQGMPGQSPYPTQPQYPLPPQQAMGTPPAYGLAGANQALQGSFGAMSQGNAMPNYGQINANRDLAMQQSRQGIKALQGYAQPGQQAGNLQADYAGANGQQAQQQAYNNFQSSPGQQWLREQAERGLLRNQAAIGGLGGGNIRQELQRQAMGLAQQDFQNQFNNLGAIGDRGMQASQLQTSLRDMAGNAASGAGAQGAGLQSSSFGANAGIGAANIGANTARARDAAQYAYQAGRDIGDNYNNTTSALAQLANQQGNGLSQLYGNYTGNIAQLLAGAGRDQSTSNQGLAQLLANLASGAGGQVAGLPGLGGATPNNSMAGMGQLLGGAGSLMGAIG